MKFRGSRSPLLGRLRKAFQVAVKSAGINAIPADELLEIHIQNAQRRRFIGNMAKAGIAFGAAGLLNACKKVSDFVPPVPVANNAGAQETILIVGAGMAGLNCAYQLKKAGYSASIYEASNRIGGRMFTQQNLVAAGVVTELGGEFIDSDHTDMLDLCYAFNIPVTDLQGSMNEALQADSYFFNGRFYSQLEVIEALQPYANRIQADIDALPDTITYDNYGNAAYYDKLSISEYFDSIGMTGWIRKALEIAYLTEYGKQPDEQSSINFLYLFSPDTSSGSLDIFGDSDERYKIQGGNMQLISAMSAQLDQHIMPGHKLLKIKQHNNDLYTLYFDNSGTTRSIKANIVVLCIPFTTLRQVEIEAELPEWKTNAIKNLGYGSNAKMLMGFKERIWRNYGYTGYLFSDETLQNGWDHGELQATTQSGYTAFVGGIEGAKIKSHAVHKQAEEFVTSLNKAWPGCKEAYNNKAHLMHWPSHPHTLGSYACYKPCQFTTIAGAEAKHIHNLYFAGEHCSLNYQGYMNGAAETGRIAAGQIIKQLSDKPQHQTRK